MRHDLIIGYGEIGHAVREVISPEAHIYDPKVKSGKPPTSINVMHICFPYSENFIQQVQDYILRYNHFTQPFGQQSPLVQLRRYTAKLSTHPSRADTPDSPRALRK